MALLPPSLFAFLEALDEPAILIRNERTVAASSAALRLLGSGIVGNDVRLAIRQPQALAAILAGCPAEVEVAGIGGLDRNWSLKVSPLGQGLLLIRLFDRSAMRAAEKMRVDFVANASHELRTPLATILGYSETLAEDGALSDELRTRFGTAIHGEARRMLRIVEDLMSLSRIEAERFDLPSEPVDLGGVAKAAADHGRALAGQRSCAIRLDIEDGLPSASGDRPQLLQLAENLIVNAIRYGCTPTSTEVIVRVKQDAGQLLLSVRDHGPGIAAVHLPRLTERFYRVDAARSRDSGGTGLGLAIVKHIVERHRGQLTINSRPGQGTDVRVRLPIAGSSVTKA